MLLLWYGTATTAGAVYLPPVQDDEDIWAILSLHQTTLYYWEVE